MQKCFGVFLEKLGWVERGELPQCFSKGHDEWLQMRESVVFLHFEINSHLVKGSEKLKEGDRNYQICTVR